MSDLMHIVVHDCIRNLTLKTKETHVDWLDLIIEIFIESFYNLLCKLSYKCF